MAGKKKGKVEEEGEAKIRGEGKGELNGVWGRKQGGRRNRSKGKSEKGERN